MRITLTWLRLDSRGHGRLLLVLALLVALATATVLTAAAGARRGQSASGRLWARTLPATAIVLPNQPGFDWAKVRALPEVSALTSSRSPWFAVDCCPAAGPDSARGQPVHPDHRAACRAGGTAAQSPPGGRGAGHPQVRGELWPGASATRSPSPGQPAAGQQGYDGTTGLPPRAEHPGPHRRGDPHAMGARRGFARPRGRRTPFTGPDDPLPGQHHGHHGRAYINALVRLKGGAAAIPRSAPTWPG